ncbi:MAG: diguanylate cyclase domain-containing protein [Pseudomonadota bacterium]
MSRISVKRLSVLFRNILGIRGRLVLMALVLVAPIMIDRVRSLEATRSQQIERAGAELSLIARNSAVAEREVISSIEALLKSSAYIHAIASREGRGCAILRASLQVDLPWIKSLSVADSNGVIQCSTLANFAGKSLADRPYFKTVLDTHEFTISDFVMGRGSSSPTVVAVYSTLAFDQRNPAVLVASVNLDWLGKIIAFTESRPGLQAMLVDSKGTIIAERSEGPARIGQLMDDLPLLGMIGDRLEGSLSMMSADGARKMMAYHRVPGTDMRMIVRIDEATMLAAINSEIRNAYLQLAVLVLIAFGGAWLTSESLIIRPIRALTGMTRRFGQGDWAVRATRKRLPAEFAPLARAFDAMAVKLAERERELVASNDRLAVIATNDLISGLANRRGFQSRLDFEWYRAEQNEKTLALLMIDVDHFKLFNDTYGHPVGDACLSQVGEALASVAHETRGFAARYGGEEFALLLPETDIAEAFMIGELVRSRIAGLAIPHAGSIYHHVTVSVGVAFTSPNATQTPNDLVEAADAALYAAKNRGRNAVITHGSGPATRDAGRDPRDAAIPLAS